MVGITISTAQKAPLFLALDPLLEIIAKLLLFCIFCIKMQPMCQFMEMIIFVELLPAGIKNGPGYGIIAPPVSKI